MHPYATEFLLLRPEVKIVQTVGGGPVHAFKTMAMQALVIDNYDATAMVKVMY